MLFEEVYITPEVAGEYGQPLPQWVILKNPADRNQQVILEASLDKGESSAIALALEHKKHLLLIDEYKGRRLASELGLSILGTFGVLLEAKRKGHLTAVKPLLEKIKVTNFHFSERLLNTILEKANEM